MKLLTATDLELSASGRKRTLSVSLVIWRTSAAAITNLNKLAVGNAGISTHERRRSKRRFEFMRDGASHLIGANHHDLLIVLDHVFGAAPFLPNRLMIDQTLREKWIFE